MLCQLFSTTACGVVCQACTRQIVVTRKKRELEQKDVVQLDKNERHFLFCVSPFCDSTHDVEGVFRHWGVYAGRCQRFVRAPEKLFIEMRSHFGRVAN